MGMNGNETKKMKVYLGGWTGETEYRSDVVKIYSEEFRIVNPMVETPHDLGSNLIVEVDKQLINACNIMVVYITRYTAGSMMEILYAWERGIPVYAITTEINFTNDIWLSYHVTKFFKYVVDCFDDIRTISKDCNCGGDCGI